MNLPDIKKQLDLLRTENARLRAENDQLRALVVVAAKHLSENLDLLVTNTIENA